MDEEGYYIDYDEDGNSYRVNALGNKLEEVEEAIKEEKEKPPATFLDDDGNPLDDEGNPIVVKEEVKTKTKSTRKRRTTKKATAKADT